MGAERLRPRGARGSYRRPTHTNDRSESESHVGIGADGSTFRRPFDRFFCELIRGDRAGVFGASDGRRGVDHERGEPGDLRSTSHPRGLWRMSRGVKGLTSVSEIREETGGEGGIRTPGTFRPNGFQDHRDRPLCHLSVITTYESKSLI